MLKWFELSAVSVSEPASMQKPAAGKQPTPVAEEYGTPSNGNAGVLDITAARAEALPAHAKQLAIASDTTRRQAAIRFNMPYLPIHASSLLR